MKKVFLSLASFLMLMTGCKVKQTTPAEEIIGNYRSDHQKKVYWLAYGVKREARNKQKCVFCASRHQKISDYRQRQKEIQKFKRRKKHTENLLIFYVSFFLGLYTIKVF